MNRIRALFGAQARMKEKKPGLMHGKTTVKRILIAEGAFMRIGRMLSHTSEMQYSCAEAKVRNVDLPFQHGSREKSA